MVIAGRSVHLTTLFSWASLNKQLTSNRAHTFACNWQQPFMNDSFSGREENDRRNYFMINLHESMGPGRDRTRDPWICSQLRICSQTRYRLSYAAPKIPVILKHYHVNLVFSDLIDRNTCCFKRPGGFGCCPFYKVVILLLFLFVWFDSLHPNQQSGQGTSLPGFNQGLMCLAQRHKAVTPVKLELTNSRFWVEHSTTELLRSYSIVVSMELFILCSVFVWLKIQ